MWLSVSSNLEEPLIRLAETQHPVAHVSHQLTPPIRAKSTQIACDGHMRLVC